MDNDCNGDESSCCEEEQTIGEIVTDYIANVGQRLEELREKGKEGAQQFAELAEQRKEQTGNYLGNLKVTLNDISNTAEEDKHIGYLVFTTGARHLAEGIKKFWNSKPSELNPKSLSGLGRIALYGGETCMGVLTTKVGAITFTVEEAIRYSKKKAEEKSAEE